jgi:hypothetical protein
MTDDRLDHLRAVAPLLWPAPFVVSAEPAAPRRSAARPSSEERRYLLLPSGRRPRLITPTSPRAAAAVVRHHGEGRGRSARLQAVGLSIAVRLGAGRWLTRGRVRITVAGRTDGAMTIEEHLSGVLGREVVIGMHLGPPRANRKPVLQVLTPEGRTLAYAKLGVDPLTDALVRAEAEALDALAERPLQGVTVPSVLHHGRWSGHQLLVQSALPVWSPRRPLTEAGLVAAAAQIAGVGSEDGVQLARSDYWAQLRARVGELPATPAATRLRHLTDAMQEVAADVEVGFGASHGDWTPWNMAALPDTLLVWDWERFRPSVPLGFDLVHHTLQTELVSRLQDPAGSAHRCVTEAPRRLAGLGLPERTAVVTALAYCLDLATRYLTDRQQEAGARLGDVDAWLLPAVEDGLEQIKRGTWT